MPLCNYFLNGMCRFGSKCHSDHIDLKALLKNEAEGVLNGKQWLLSCFGPFKESANFPNFIEDQSFEEVRMGFLENSKNGNLQNYVNNLSGTLQNAMHKMNELKMPSNEIIQIVANIYNNNTASNDQKKPAQTPASNPFQSTNIFGGSTTTQQPQNSMSTASIFGQQTTQSNPFSQVPQQQSTNIFGATGSAVQPSSFGAASNTAQQSPFSFALNQPSQPKPSIFGQSSIFGGGSQTQSTNSSIFGGGQSQSTNVFAQATSNAFSMASNTPAQTSIFGSSVPQQSMQPQQTMQPQQSMQPQQTMQNSQQSIFGSTQMPQQSQPSVFGSVGFSQPSSVFGGSQQPQTQAPPQQNIFQQQPTNIFSQFSNQQSSMNQSQEPPRPQYPQMFNTPFSSEQQQQQPQGTSPFQMASNNQMQPGQVPSNVNPFQPPPPINDEHFYSKIEDLSPEDIQAYQADSFIPGKIPLLPPTKQFALG